MLAQGSKLNPIEVKSSGYSTHASIDRFIQKYSSRVGEKYLIYTKDYRKDRDITLLPVFFCAVLVKEHGRNDTAPESPRVPALFVCAV
jgi:hypothetical protein